MPAYNFIKYPDGRGFFAKIARLGESETNDIR